MQGPDTDSLVRVSDVEEKDDLADVSVDWGNDRKELAAYWREPGLCPELFTSPSLSLCLKFSRGSGLWLTFFKWNIFNNSDWTFLFLKLCGNSKLFKIPFKAFMLFTGKQTPPEIWVCRQRRGRGRGWAGGSLGQAWPGPGGPSRWSPGPGRSGTPPPSCPPPLPAAARH